MVVTGSAGADTLILGGGADIITGGAGVDIITTGGGSDLIRYVAAGATTADADRITDFTVGVGGDKIGIDVSAFAGAIIANLTNSLVALAAAADNSIIVDTANTGYISFAAAEAAVEAANAGTDDYLLVFHNTTSGFVEVWADASSAAVGNGVLIASFTSANTVPTAGAFLTGLISANFDLTI